MKGQGNIHFTIFNVIYIQQRFELNASLETSLIHPLNSTFMTWYKFLGKNCLIVKRNYCWKPNAIHLSLENHFRTSQSIATILLNVIVWFSVSIIFIACIKVSLWLVFLRKVFTVLLRSSEHILQLHAYGKENSNIIYYTFSAWVKICLHTFLELFNK